MISIPRTIVAIGCMLLPSVVSSQQLSKSSIDKVRKACVEIQVDGELRGGGAFVKDSSGKVFIITAAHLFSSPSKICRVLTSSEEFLTARIKAYDLGFDLALLEIKEPISNALTCAVADRVPAEGASLFNFGPALRRRTLVITGNVADARISYTDFAPYEGYLGHFFIAGISPELTSGGVWVNGSGEIVGIQNGRLRGDAGSPSSGLSMASPPQAISNLIESKKKASTPGIGGWIWELWNMDQKLVRKLPSDTNGLMIGALQKNGALARAGLKLHDVITHCNGQPVIRHDTFLEKVRFQPAGTEFSLRVITPGKSSFRNVTLKTISLESQWR